MNTTSKIKKSKVNTASIVYTHLFKKSADLGIVFLPTGMFLNA